MADDASEMSVHFDATGRRWLAVYNDPTPSAEAGFVSMRRADRPEGPWSAPEPLFRIPEPRSGKHRRLSR